jgi:hypothetical protein
MGFDPAPPTFSIVMRVRYPGGASGGGKPVPGPNIGVTSSSSSSGAPPSSTRAVPLIDSHGVNGPLRSVDTTVTDTRGSRRMFRSSAKSRHQSQLGVNGLDVTHLATLEGSVLSAQVTSRCLVDDWFHARSRRASLLHRWGVDDAAAAELPARSSARPQRDARRAPALLVPWRTHDLDVSRLRQRGVRATAERRLPDSRRCRSGALAPLLAPLLA